MIRWLLEQRCEHERLPSHAEPSTPVAYDCHITPKDQDQIYRSTPSRDSSTSDILPIAVSIRTHDSLANQIDKLSSHWILSSVHDCLYVIWRQLLELWWTDRIVLIDWQLHKNHWARMMVGWDWMSEFISLHRSGWLGSAWGGYIRAEISMSYSKQVLDADSGACGGL